MELYILIGLITIVLILQIVFLLKKPKSENTAANTNYESNFQHIETYIADEFSRSRKETSESLNSRLSEMNALIREIQQINTQQSEKLSTTLTKNIDSLLESNEKKLDQMRQANMEQNEKISSLQNEQAQLQSEMNSLDAQLSEVLVNIQILSDEITQKQAELEDVGNQLVQAQQNEQTEYEDMKLRIQYMYENGDSTMLQSLLESKDISDFVNRAEYVNSVYSYDRNLLIQYQQTVQQVADLQIQVQGEEAELEEIQESYEEQ